MPALNFKKQFVPAIRARTKQHTIRAERKDGKVPQPGELYSLYCGMRTKNCFRILEEQVVVTQVQKIEIHLFEDAVLRTVFLRIDGTTLCPDECDALAKADGFESIDAFYEFWDGRLPFKGHIIHWK